MASVERLDAAAWERLRDVRLRALLDAPDAFGSSHAKERGNSEHAWRRVFEHGPWWVAVAGDDDVGLVAGGRHDGTDVPWMYSMWVAAAHRGAGVAELLFDQVVAWAGATGATRLGLDVTDRVPRARRFYERLGFEPTGVDWALPRDRTIGLTEMAVDLARLTARDRGPR